MPKNFLRDLPREIRDQIYRETAFSIERPHISNSDDEYEVLIRCPYFELAVQRQNDPKFLPLARAALVSKQFSQEFKEVFDTVQNEADRDQETWVMECMAVISGAGVVPFSKVEGFLRYRFVSPSYRPVPRYVMLDMELLVDPALLLGLNIQAVPYAESDPKRLTWPQALAQMIIEIGTQLYFCRDPTDLALWADPPGAYNDRHELETKRSPLAHILIRTRVKQSSKPGEKAGEENISQDPSRGDDLLEHLSPELSLQLADFLAKRLGMFFGQIGVHIRDGKSKVSRAPFDLSQLIPDNHELECFAIAFNYGEAVPGHHLHRSDIPSHNIVHLRKLWELEGQRLAATARDPLARAHAEAHASLARRMQMLGLIDVPGPVHTFQLPFNRSLR